MALKMELMEIRAKGICHGDKKQSNRHTNPGEYKHVLERIHVR